MLVEMREYVDIGLFGSDNVLSISWLSQAGDKSGLAWSWCFFILCWSACAWSNRIAAQFILIHCRILLHSSTVVRLTISLLCSLSNNWLHKKRWWHLVCCYPLPQVMACCRSLESGRMYYFELINFQEFFLASFVSKRSWRRIFIRVNFLLLFNFIMHTPLDKLVLLKEFFFCAKICQE